MTEMKVELRDEYSTPNPDQLAAMAARGDYMNDSLVGTDYDEAMGDRDLQDFLNEKVYKGHFGVFEHPQASFFVEGLSRSAMAQVTRHRHMSFDVQSQRYVDFSEKDPVVPPSFDWYWEKTLKQFWRVGLSWYQQAVDDGIPKEDARFFLPLAAPVNMTLTANPRSLFHFLDLRDNAKAQWEAQEFAQEIGDVASDWAPKSFRAYDEKTNNNSLRAP
jgi:thymidylate synthase (FAD)